MLQMMSSLFVAVTINCVLWFEICGNRCFKSVNYVFIAKKKKKVLVPLFVFGGSFEINGKN
jgi:hypothetical protein